MNRQRLVRSSCAEVCAPLPAPSAGIGPVAGAGWYDAKQGTWIVLACLLMLLSTGSAWATDWFGPADETVIPSGSQRIAVGELSGDTYPDVVIGYEDVLRLYVSDEFGGFVPGLEITSPDAAWNVAVGDFDGDGNDDIASTDYSSGPQRIHYGDGAGGFSRTESFDTVLNNGIPFLRSLDIDEDGFDDLVLPSNPDVLVCWGSPNGMIVDPELLDYSLNAFCTSIVSDLVIARTATGGFNDIVVLFADNDYTCGGNQANRVIARFRNLGNRQFGPVEFLVVDPYTDGGDDWKAIGAGDVDGDADLDFVVVGGDPVGLQSVIKVAPATWALGPTSGWTGSRLAVADFDGDALDLVMGGYVFRGTGLGTFEYVCPLAAPYDQPVCADFDGDGDTDVAGKSGSRLYVSMNIVNDPASIEDPNARAARLVVVPAVVEPGGHVEIRGGGSGRIDVLDVSGRVITVLSGAASTEATVAWAVPAGLAQGRYWLRSADGVASGSFVVVR